MDDARDLVGLSRAVTARTLDRGVAHPHFEACAQVALVAMWEASLSWDPDRSGASFSTHAYHVARRRIIDELRVFYRTEAPGRRIRPPPTPLGVLDRPDEARREEGYAEVEVADLCDRLRRRLPEREAAALLAPFYGVRLYQLAERWGVDPTEISRLRKSGRAHALPLLVEAGVWQPPTRRGKWT